MRKQTRVLEKQSEETGFLLEDPLFEIWANLDQTADVVSKARELELNQFSLTKAQALILHSLMTEKKGLTIAEISRMRAKEPNSVLNLIKTMLKKGLVQKSKEDNKVSILITEKGRSQYSNSTKQSIDLIFSILSKEEIQQLHSILQKVRERSRSLLGIDYKPPFLR
jgi:DNA-binding MarR family transcriptional regulator